MILSFVAMSLAVVMISVTSLGAIAGYSIAAKVTENSVDILDADEQPPPSIGEYSGGFNILIVGADNDRSPELLAWGPSGEAR